jgi:hypothetical protein
VSVLSDLPSYYIYINLLYELIFQQDRVMELLYVIVFGRFVRRAGYIVNTGPRCLLCGLLQVNKRVMAPMVAEYTHFCNKYNQGEGVQDLPPASGVLSSITPRNIGVSGGDGESPCLQRIQ